MELYAFHDRKCENTTRVSVNKIYKLLQSSLKTALHPGRLVGQLPTNSGVMGVVESGRGYLSPFQLGVQGADIPTPCFPVPRKRLPVPAHALCEYSLLPVLSSAPGDSR